MSWRLDPANSINSFVVDIADLHNLLTPGLDVPRGCCLQLHTVFSVVGEPIFLKTNSFVLDGVKLRETFAGRDNHVTGVSVDLS